ncbi:MAG: hypothetical protein J5529_07155 [Prevotella sp.]|nr:hypothetical protein [Prevotella sp.]
MPYELKPTAADNVRVGLTGATALGLGAGLTQPIVLGTGLVGGALGDAAVNTGSRLFTGKSWADNVSDWTGLPTELSVWTNPGMFYGGWVGNNFGHLGRYTLNYLDPRGYGNYFARLKDVFTKPFYTKPPTFFNGRKPQWYGNQGFFNDDEIRFQNGAIWAGIPENEVPRTLI